MGNYLRNKLWNWCLVACVSRPISRHGQQRGRAFVSLSHVLSLTTPPIPKSYPLVFFSVCVCLSLPPRAPTGPLVCLTRLWLQDLCVQCVIIGPTLSCGSLSVTDCSLRHTDPFVYCPKYSFICTWLSLAELTYLVYSPFQVVSLSCSPSPSSASHLGLFSVSLHHPWPLPF